MPSTGGRARLASRREQISFPWGCLQCHDKHFDFNKADCLAKGFRTCEVFCFATRTRPCRRGIHGGLRAREYVVPMLFQSVMNARQVPAV